eukprot:EG_transcript_26097
MAVDIDYETAKLNRLLQLGKIDAEYHAQRLSKVFEMSSKPAPAENVYTLCLLHVHIQMTREQLQERMEVFGKVVKLEMLPSKSKPRKEWWAVFVEYETQEAAFIAMQTLNNDMPDDWPLQIKPLLVKWTGSKEDTEKYRQQQAQEAGVAGGRGPLGRPVPLSHGGKRPRPPTGGGPNAKRPRGAYTWV